MKYTKDLSSQPSIVELEVVEYLNAQGQYVFSPKVNSSDETLKSPGIEEENPLEKSQQLTKENACQSSVNNKKAMSSFKQENAASQFRLSKFNSPFIDQQINKDVREIYFAGKPNNKGKNSSKDKADKSQEKSSFEPEKLRI